MIELMTVAITSEEDIVELRNKILTLFSELKFNEMDGVNFTTKISDKIHHQYFKTKQIKVEIGCEKKRNGFNLIVLISDDSAADPTRFSFLIMDPEFTTEQSKIQKIKEKVVVQSKAELIRQVQHKNMELGRLLEELKKSSSMIQSEKMRALGVLTAGVAHELNNPMMGILNFIQYCLKKTQEDDKRFEALKDAEHETKRCIEIVANLLTFSHMEKEGVDKFQPVNLSVLLRRVVKILSYRLRNEAITVHEHITEDLPSILGHENRLQQVILNLFTNALDAMKTVEVKHLDFNLYAQEDQIIINISDTGQGMDEETKHKVFEPFFTTKPAGSGTGLGLSVSESIIREHGGSIVCKTELKKGTTFSISLPMNLKDES